MFTFPDCEKNKFFLCWVEFRNFSKVVIETDIIIKRAIAPTEVVPKTIRGSAKPIQAAIKHLNDLETSFTLLDVQRVSGIPMHGVIAYYETNGIWGKNFKNL